MVWDRESGVLLRQWKWATAGSHGQGGIDSITHSNTSNSYHSKVIIDVQCGGDLQKSLKSERAHLKSVGLPEQQCGRWLLYCPNEAAALKLQLQLQNEAARAGEGVSDSAK